MLASSRRALQLLPRAAEPLLWDLPSEAMTVLAAISDSHAIADGHVDPHGTTEDRRNAIPLGPI